MTRVWAIAIVAVVLVSGCDGDVESGAPRDAEISAFQAEILSDQNVTFGEMELAVAAYSDCLATFGITTEAAYDDASKAYGYHFSAQGEDVEALLESPSGFSCKAEYLDRVELVFADQMGPSAEEDAEFYANIAECMNKRGYDVQNSDPGTLGALYERHPGDYLDCFDEVAGLE